jgi:acyl carrier protein
MKNGEKLLVLYFTVDQLQHDIPIITQEIKTKLANELPEHMMPSMIQYLAEFPLNANGKVDRKKLPLPSFKRKIVEPKNEIEQRLLLIWQDLLQIDILSVEDNFFEVGGHSLIATKLIVRVRSHFSVSLPLTSLFKSPTIRSCAELIESELKYQLSESLTAKHSTNENTMLVDEVII